MNAVPLILIMAPFIGALAYIIGTGFKPYIPPEPPRPKAANLEQIDAYIRDYYERRSLPTPPEETAP
jgi:hypothetical protein